MRVLLVNILAFSTVGGILGTLGVGYSSWQYWGITLCMVMTGINCTIPENKS